MPKDCVMKSVFAPTVWLMRMASASEEMCEAFQARLQIMRATQAGSKAAMNAEAAATTGRPG